MILLYAMLSLAWAQGDPYDEPLFRQLAAYDGVSCQQLFHHREADEVRDALLRYATEQRDHSTVAMRSVTCLVSQLPEDEVVQQAASGWVGDIRSPGYALIVAQHLDHMPQERAVTLGRDLLAREPAESPRIHAHLVRTLQGSAHPRVRALVIPQPTQD